MFLLTVVLMPLVPGGATSPADVAPLFGEGMFGTGGTAEMDQESISRSQTLTAEENWAAFGFNRLADSS
jgi:hypothetical protein